jgi:hypothetical protein
MACPSRNDPPRNPHHPVLFGLRRDGAGTGDRIFAADGIAPGFILQEKTALAAL